MPESPPNPTPPVDHGARAHARFSPSASERWLACPHSIPFTEALVAARQIPDPETERSGEAAARGTFAHEVAEACLSAQSLDPLRNAATTLASDERIWLTHQVTVYWHLLHQIREAAALVDTPQLIIEERVELSEDVWGSIDAAVIALGSRELWVVDLKTGHRQVSAERNPQLLTYAAAIAKRYRWAFDRVNLSISQAECDPPCSSWSCDIQTLKRHVRACSEAVRKAHNYDARHPEFNTGEHCLYCPAKAHCPAQRQMAVGVFGGDALSGANPQMPSPSALSAEQIASVLRHGPQIEAWFDSIRRHVLATRPRIEGFKVVESVTRARWRNEDEALTFFRTLHPEMIREALPTITAARPVLSPEERERLLIRPPGSPTIVPDSDPRPRLETPLDVLPSESEES